MAKANCDILPVDRFTAAVKSEHIEFQVIHLEQSLFVWVGTGAPDLSELCLALETSYQKIPLVTSIFSKNTAAGSYSTALSQRLAKRTGKQVFVSYNIHVEDPDIHQAVQSRLIEELAAV